MPLDQFKNPHKFDEVKLASIKIHLNHLFEVFVAYWICLLFTGAILLAECIMHIRPLQTVAHLICKGQTKKRRQQKIFGLIYDQSNYKQKPTLQTKKVQFGFTFCIVLFIIYLMFVKKQLKPTLGKSTIHIM